MAYSHKTFRKCGSHYSELAAIEGVEIKVGEKFRPPRKITLPVGFHPKDPSDVLSLSYDFSLENEIIAKAEEEKQKQLQLELKQQEEQDAALKAQEQASDTATSDSPTAPISIFSNVGTDILQPVTVSSASHKRNDSLGKNTFDLSDFEANGTNPFELVELQTINDLDVLKSVLEPVTHSSSMETTGSMAVASAGASTNVTPSSAMGSMAQPSHSSKPFSYLSNQTPIPSTSQENSSKLNSKLSKSVPDLCDDQLVDISSDENHSRLVTGVSSSTSRSVSPPSSAYTPSQPNANVSMGYGMPSQPFNYLQGRLPVHCGPSAQPTTSSVLVNINSQTSTYLSETMTPLNLISTSSVPMSNPVAETSGTAVNSSNNRLPPLRKAPPIPPRPTGRKNVKNIESISSSLQGLTVADGPSVSAPLPATVTCSQNTSRIPGNYMTHNSEVSTSTVTSGQSVIKRQPAQKRSKSSMDDVRRHSTPLPPITPPPHSTAPYIAKQVGPPPPTPPSPQSVLPDPMPVLNESEKTLAQYIAGMGFPIPRVARAVQRLGAKDREVVDFLVAVEELCQKGFSGDNAEIALTFNDDDAKKALEFLNLAKTFKELGFQELHIHEALKAADNDSDKALDFLASISAS